MTLGMVWFWSDGTRHEARIIHQSGSTVDLEVLFDNFVNTRMNVPLVPTGTSAPGDYAEIPAANDLPDGDKIDEARRYAIPHEGDPGDES